MAAVVPLGRSWMAIWARTKQERSEAEVSETLPLCRKAAAGPCLAVAAADGDPCQPRITSVFAV